MNKNLSKLFLVFLVICTVVFVFIFIQQKDNVRIGFGTEEELELKNGIYSNGNLNLSGEYAVVSISGEGLFKLSQEDNIVIEELNLDEFLYQDIKKRAPQMINQILYEEGKKVDLSNFDKILIDGNESFVVKLIKR